MCTLQISSLDVGYLGKLLLKIGRREPCHHFFPRLSQLTFSIERDQVLHFVPYKMYTSDIDLWNADVCYRRKKLSSSRGNSVPRLTEAPFTAAYEGVLVGRWLGVGDSESGGSEFGGSLGL